MNDDIVPGATPAPAELADERTEFSHRLASFGLGEKPARLLEEAARRPSRAIPKPVGE